MCFVLFCGGDDVAVVVAPTREESIYWGPVRVLVVSVEEKLIYN